MRFSVHKLLSSLICKVARNFWHGETDAKNALVLDGCITMRKWLCAPRQHADQPGLSRFLIYPPSSRLPRRLSVQAATVFIGRFAMTRVTQSPRLALRQSRVSRTPSTLLFSSLLSQNSTEATRWKMEMKKRRRRRRSCETRVRRNDVRHVHARGVSHGPRSSFCIRSRFDNRPVATSPASLQLIIQFPPRTRHSYTTRLRDLRDMKRDCHTKGWMNFCEE